MYTGNGVGDGDLRREDQDEKAILSSLMHTLIHRLPKWNMPRPFRDRVKRGEVVT